MVEYFIKKLTKPELELEGLSCQATPLGDAVVLDQKRTGVCLGALENFTLVESLMMKPLQIFKQPLYKGTTCVN